MEYNRHPFASSEDASFTPSGLTLAMSYKGTTNYTYRWPEGMHRITFSNLMEAIEGCNLKAPSPFEIKMHNLCDNRAGLIHTGNSSFWREK
jgi:hypothetical protein